MLIDIFDQWGTTRRLSVCCYTSERFVQCRNLFFLPNDVVMSALTCSFSSLYDPWRGVCLRSGTSVSQQQNRGAEGQNSKHFSKHTPIILLSICVFMNHETETTRFARVSDEILKACWREIFWVVWDLCHLRYEQAKAAELFPPICERTGNREERKALHCPREIPALGRRQPCHDHKPPHSSISLSASPPPVFPFISESL